MKKIFFVTVFFSNVLFSIITHAADYNLSSIQYESNIGDVLIKSGRGAVLFNYVKVDSLGSKAAEEKSYYETKLSHAGTVVVNNTQFVKMSFWFDGIKLRCNETSTTKLPTEKRYKQNWQWAYNGEKTELLRLDGLGEGGLIIPMASVKSESDFPAERFDPRYNGLNILGTPVGTFLKGTLGKNSVKDIAILKNEKVGDFDCVVVQGSVSETGETVSVWLAQETIYRPKKIEIKSETELIVINNSFKKYSDEVWFPEKVRKDKYYIDGTTGEKTLYSYEEIIVDDKYEINVDLPETLFEIVFPVGLSVYDFRIGESYEVK